MLTKQTVVEKDTHTVVWSVWDVSDPDNPVPVDLTGSTASFRFKKGNEPTITAAGFVKDDDPQVDNLVAHQLTGTLTTGTYSVQVVLVKEGVQTTAPTLKVGTLVVTAAL